MIKKFLFALGILLSCTVANTQAQTDAQAEKVLNDLLNLAKTSAIRTNFKLSMTIKADPQAQVTTGSFTLKGSKFVLDMNQMKVWFNGKTQWSYVEQNKEVSITEPTEKELGETNPMAIIAGFKTKSDIRFAPKGNSGSTYIIDMTPKSKKMDISKIQVSINKSSGNLVSIKSFYYNGSVNLLTLSNFEKGVSVNDNIFTFNQAKFKGVNINDLR